MDSNGKEFDMIWYVVHEHPEESIASTRDLFIVSISYPG